MNFNTIPKNDWYKEIENYPEYDFSLWLRKALYSMNLWGILDYMISTIPVQSDVAAYPAMVKRCGFFTQAEMPVGYEMTLSDLGLASSGLTSIYS